MDNRFEELGNDLKELNSQLTSQVAEVKLIKIMHLLPENYFSTNDVIQLIDKKIFEQSRYKDIINNATVYSKEDAIKVMKKLEDAGAFGNQNLNEQKQMNNTQQTMAVNYQNYNNNVGYNSQMMHLQYNDNQQMGYQYPMYNYSYQQVMYQNYSNMGYNQQIMFQQYNQQYNQQQYNQQMMYSNNNTNMMYNNQQYNANYLNQNNGSY